MPKKNDMVLLLDISVLGLVSSPMDDSNLEKNSSMSETSKASLPGMEGGGFYNRHSSLQEAAIVKALPIWRDLIGSARIDDTLVTIADYGSSQGRNSMLPIGLAIAMIKETKGPAVAFNVIHTDLPGNDFTSLFQSIAEDDGSYLRKGDSIYSSAVGRSYFEQILPSGSVDLGWNSWTLQWMSRNPIEDPDSIYGVLSADKEVREAVKKQLSEDWRVFLQKRSLELKPGGKLFSLFGSKGPGNVGWEWSVNTFWAGVIDMYREGLISYKQKLALSWPLGPRDIEAIKEPFGEMGVYEGMRLEHAEIIQSPDPFWPIYLTTKDQFQFGQNWKNFFKAVFAPAMKSQLGNTEETAALVDEMFERFGLAMSASPRETEHFVGIAVVEKVQ